MRIYLLCTIGWMLLWGSSTNADAARLSDRIPAVSGRHYPKAQRLEVAVSGGLTHNDAFYTMSPIAGVLRYHVSESFSVGVLGELRLASEKSLLIDGASSGEGDFSSFDRAEQIIGGELEWAPLYGKVSLAGEATMHFDGSVALGAGTLQSQQGQQTTFVSLALGQRFFINRNVFVQYRLRGLAAPLSRIEEEVSDGWNIELASSLGLGLLFF